MASRNFFLSRVFEITLQIEAIKSDYKKQQLPIANETKL